MKTNRKKPTGLIKNQPITPEKIDHYKPEKKKGRNSKGATEMITIKISTETKRDIDLVMTLTDNSFVYNMVDQIVSFYIENALNSDAKSAFNILRNLDKNNT